MPRPGVDYEAVARAAAQLVAEGQLPSIDRVRAVLGHTGSRSTLGPLLKRWRQAHQTEVALTGTGLPPEWLQAATDTYTRLQIGAERELAQLRETYRAEQEIWDEVRAALQRDVSAVDRQRAEANDALARKNQQCEALRSEYQALERQLACVQSSHTALVEHLATQEQMLTEITRQWDAARQQFEHYQAAVAEQREHERQQAADRIAALERDLPWLRRQLVELERERDGLRVQVGQTDGLCGQLQTVNSQLTTQCAVLGTEREQLLARVSELNGRLTQADDTNTGAAAWQTRVDRRLQRIDISLATLVTVRTITQDTQRLLHRLYRRLRQNTPRWDSQSNDLRK